MRPRTVLSSLSIVVVTLAVLGLSSASSDPVACPSGTDAPAADGGSAAADGAAAAALHGESLVLVDERGGTDRYRHVAGRAGLLRHANTRPGSGTVYVNDLRGPDTVILLRDGRTERLRTNGEAIHPAVGPGGALVWAEDLRRLRLRAGSGRPVRTISAPPGARAVFSPAFLGRDRVLAVVEEHVAGVPHDSALDNLYGVDPGLGRWVRLTDFEAGTERWSAIRTPVVGRDGSVWFVRVTGRASATRPPGFELWRLDGQGATRVRTLPVDTYLAGAVGGRLLWNVYEPRSGAWRLLLGGADGTALVGCGAGSTDPVASDPDVAQKDPADTGSEPAEAPVPEDGTLGIVVGDFDTREEARAAAERIGAPAQVTGHGRSPAAVGPDRFAAALPLEPGGDAVSALDGFRERFPEYGENSWIAVIGAAGEEGR